MDDLCIGIGCNKKLCKCNVDDIIDAICLAVAASFVAENKYQSLPPVPMADETGILMQMVIPELT